MSQGKQHKRGRGNLCMETGWTTVTVDGTVGVAYSGLFSYIAVFTLARFSATPLNNGILFMVVGVFQMIGQGIIVYRLAPRFGEK